MRVLAIDPGLEKCGVAACGPEGVMARRVVKLGQLRDLAGTWIQAYELDRVIVGNGTGYKHTFDMISGLRVPVSAVAEVGSTLEARRRYFRDHPPRGWRRLLPLSFQVPPEPYDDYAAEVLGERYLERLQAGRSQAGLGEAGERP